MTDTGNSDAAPIDPQHGSSGPGGPVFPGPEVPPPTGQNLTVEPDARSPQHTNVSQPDLEHPAWCSPAHCTVADDRNRWHASRPVTVRGTGDTSDLSITVQIFAWPDGGNAYVDIAPTLIDMEGGTTTEEWPVPAELALELGHVLVSLARQATP